MESRGAQVKTSRIGADSEIRNLPVGDDVGRPGSRIVIETSKRVSIENCVCGAYAATNYIQICHETNQWISALSRARSDVELCQPGRCRGIVGSTEPKCRTRIALDTRRRKQPDASHARRCRDIR